MQKRNKKGVFVKTGRWRPCKECSSPFWVKPCNEGKSKYCSKPCANKGAKGRKLSKETIEKIVAKNRGKKRSEEWKSERSQESFGEKNPNWKGGVSKNVRRRRHRNLSAKLIREIGMCQTCNATEDLELDHKIPWGVSPELRYERSNLQVLCKPCHRIKTRGDGKKYWKNQFGQSEFYAAPPETD